MTLTCAGSISSSGATGFWRAKYFRDALALQPNYAAANAGLAEALVTQTLASEVNGADVIPAAIATAKRAVELDPGSGEAYTALGSIEAVYSFDWDAADRNLRKGIALSPNSSDAETWFAVYLTSVGRPLEAVAAMRRAVALDPLSFWANRLLGSMLFYARHYDESLATLARAAELAPDKSAFVSGWVADNDEMLERYREAIEADLKDQDLSPADTVALRAAFQAGGWRGYQEARLRLSQSRNLGDCSYAMSYLRLGNTEEALRWFTREIDTRCGTAMFDIASDPRLDTLRKDPRFPALLRRAHLAQ